MGKDMAVRSVYLGTKPCQGYESYATHWAVMVGEPGDQGSWSEIDGGSGADKLEADLTRNTINGGCPGVLWRGGTARSGATVKLRLGETKRSDKELEEFNRKYLACHPTYSVVTSNCQDYTYQLVEFLTGDTSKLPAREVRKYAGYGALATAAGIGLGIAAFKWFSKDKKEDAVKKEKKDNDVENDVSEDENKEKNMKNIVVKG